MKQAKDFLSWKLTRTGLLISGTIELILAYIFGSRALDTGSYWHYLGALVFFIGTIKSYVQALKITHGKN
ncbi:hypothetical protein HY003_00895 [Candidatus Saccharibacteria bacterium]|nr:hypothetical protein [Candidatus Saccharibacteria bacterium]MBI3337840.1 hypothetical protein [Candidatus Saccharibacteria bacterium]